MLTYVALVGSFSWPHSIPLYLHFIIYVFTDDKYFGCFWL